MGRRDWFVAGLLLSIVVPAIGQRHLDERPAGRIDDTAGVTANNWTLQPVGRLTEIDEFPQACVISPNGKYLAVTNAGHGVHSVMLFDVASGKLVQRVPFGRPKAIFRGLAFSPNSSTLYVSGGPSDVLRVITVQPGAKEDVEVPEIKLRLDPSKPPVDNPEEFAGLATLPDPSGKGVVLYPGDVAVSPDPSKLWVAEVLGNAVAVVDPSSGAVEQRSLVGANPYEIKLDPANGQAFVSLWGESAVAVLDNQARMKAKVAVDAHPTGMALDARASRLYVTCAHADSVSIIDTTSLAVVGKIELKPYPNAPLGSAPTAVVVADGGQSLVVACSGENAITRVALNADKTAGEVTGRLPAGWYPTGLAQGPDGALFVVSARGLGSTQNAYPKRKYIAQSMQGLLQAIVKPTDTQWRAGLAQVASFNNQQLGRDVRFRPEALDSPIPSIVGGASPIRYCIYIIKENRTYDQVFGDLPGGAGDPKLCMFGWDVTPNQHRLALDYGLLDNFYVNGTVSVDGHQWAKNASVGDGQERGWGESYSQRGPGLPGPVSAPATKQIWLHAADYGLTYKVVSGGMKPNGDLERVANYLKEMAQWEQDGEMPRLSVIHLPDNHTFGSAKDRPTPSAMVAENDLALGQLMEGLTNSRFWPQMAVFIVEDDAQDGPDHIDSHRSPCLVLSPYAKRGVVDSTHYDQMSVLRTMELILGLPPLSQFDAAALPMWSLFTNQPTVSKYEPVTPKQPLDQMNALGAYGQQWCDAQDWAEIDAQPWPEFNRILWAATMGVDAPLPVVLDTRFAMAVSVAGEGDDED